MREGLRTERRTHDGQDQAHCARPTGARLRPGTLPRLRAAHPPISIFIFLQSRRFGCLVSTMAVIFRPQSQGRGRVRTSLSSKLVLGCAAILSVALVAGKLEPFGRTRSAAAQGSPLRAPAKPDETAAPVLDPAIYHHVAQVIWVVNDIDRVVDYWQRLGVHKIHRDGVVSFPNLTYRGKRDSARAKQVTANLGDLEIKWTQPMHGGRFWRDGLRQHGDGIRVLGYAVRSPQEFDDQIKYFSS